MDVVLTTEKRGAVLRAIQPCARSEASHAPGRHVLDGETSLVCITRSYYSQDVLRAKFVLNSICHSSIVGRESNTTLVSNKL